MSTAQRLVCVVGVVLLGWPSAAGAQSSNAWPVPRHANFLLDPNQSQVQLSLFWGGVQSPLSGSVRLYLGDPRVPVPMMGPVAGWVGLSVDGADLVATQPMGIPGLPDPVHMIQNPNVHSTGLWNTVTYQVQFQLYLMAVSSSAASSGGLPVPQPVYLTGTLATYTDAATTPVLSVSGNNGNVADGTMWLTIKAYEAQIPPPGVDVWFSTVKSFRSGVPTPLANAAMISDGDLLSRTGHIVRTNHELTRKLGIMPTVPDLGLDAVAVGPRGVIWFSFSTKAVSQIWSETLGVWLKHGDLLSEEGYVVATNEQLLAGFVRMPPVSDAGLDAVARGPNGALLFSTKLDFFSEKLGGTVGHGDLLSNRGYILMRNWELLRNFRPPQTFAYQDYGLDAVVLRSNGETWFSTTLGFQDARLGPISDGDLLSTSGYIVARNRDLLAAFKPTDSTTTNFGLDAATVVLPSIKGDLDGDGDVDQADFGLFQVSYTGSLPAGQVAANEAAAGVGDMDGDGDTDQNDFGIFQLCLSGAGMPAGLDCE